MSFQPTNRRSKIFEGHEPALRGIVTRLLRKFDNSDGEYDHLVEEMLPTNRMADAMGWPVQWLVCPHCGAWSWRLPPHAMDPCPLVVEAAESQGMKVDAERSMAIRAGVHYERMAEMFQEHLGRLNDEDDDE